MAQILLDICSCVHQYIYSSSFAQFGPTVASHILQHMAMHPCKQALDFGFNLAILLIEYVCMHLYVHNIDGEPQPPWDKWGKKSYFWHG